MIILLAMANSLATRENSPRGPNGPPGRAARGVYVGDGEIWRLGSERSRFSGLTTPARSATNRPRRTDCGGKVVVSPSEHRHPENKTWHGSSPFKRRRMTPMSRSRTRRQPMSGRSIRCFLPAIFLHRSSSADHTGEPTDGPTTRPDVIRASRRPSHDGPAKCLAQPTSKSTARTRSEFVTPLK